MSALKAAILQGKSCFILGAELWGSRFEELLHIVNPISSRVVFKNISRGAYCEIYNLRGGKLCAQAHINVGGSGGILPQEKFDF